MQFIKLQLGCLLVILFIEIAYLKAAKQGHLPHHRLFDALMLVAPWAVFFDGLTAWTVNHLDVVPDGWNRAAHFLFFAFMELTVLVTTLYMYDQLVGFQKGERKKKLLLAAPGLVALALTAVGMGQLEFRQGATTNYSMGLSVYAAFGSVILYYGALLFLTIRRRKFLSQEKVLETLSFIGIAGGILVVQLRFPEVLLTAIFPTILLLGIYIDFENPSIRKLTRYNAEIVEGFATMVENRDQNTGGHIKRTRAYVDLLLRQMRHDKRYHDRISRDYLNHVSNAAPLHDIGKIATPDHILQKPGRLTAEEFAVIREHAAIGGKIVQAAFRDLGDEAFRTIAYEVARYHHEKYNGTGYPEGLAGEAIPLHARVMAIADVFDAVSQKRCYRDAMSLDESFAILEHSSGSDFDPQLTELFLAARDDIAQLVKEGAACSAD